MSLNKYKKEFNKRTQGEKIAIIGGLLLVSGFISSVAAALAKTFLYGGLIVGVIGLFMIIKENKGGLK